MGGVSVEIAEETRSRLEELRDEFYRQTGRRVSTGELLEICIDTASREELIEAFSDEFEGLDEEERRRALGDTSDWDGESTGGGVDEILYDE